MTGTNETRQNSPIAYQALPELEDSQYIEAEIDALLSLVMEMAAATTDDLQQALEQFGKTDDLEFLLARKRQFLATLLREGKWEQLPEAAFGLLIRIAVYEPDPSFNRGFIEPCLRAFGYPKVQQALLEYLENGTNREKAGAARAFYWAQLNLLVPDWFDQHLHQKWQNENEFIQAAQKHQNDIKKAEQAFQKMCNEELADLRLTIAITMLKEFVENDNLDVRRSIIPQLSLRPLDYPNESRTLIPVAIDLARKSTDIYIRHRVEIQIHAADEQHHNRE